MTAVIYHVNSDRVTWQHASVQAQWEVWAHDLDWIFLVILLTLLLPRAIIAVCSVSMRGLPFWTSFYQTGIQAHPQTVINTSYDIFERTKLPCIQNQNMFVGWELSPTAVTVALAVQVWWKKICSESQIPKKKPPRALRPSRNHFALNKQTECEANQKQKLQSYSKKDHWPGQNYTAMPQIRMSKAITRWPKANLPVNYDYR